MKMTTAREPFPFLFTPPHSPFAVPSGSYRAVLKSVSTVESEIEEGQLLLQLVFDVVAGENGPVNYAACLEYPEGKEGHRKLNSDLVAFLEPWEIDQMLGMPHELDLLSFIGDEVDMTVVTSSGSDDEPPYSKITGVYRAGSLVRGSDRLG